MYLGLADIACERITRGIVAHHVGGRPVKAVLDPYNPAGSTIHVRFTTSKKTLWTTDARYCHINYVVCDSDWEAEFCSVAQGHPRVRAYVKNHGLGLEVPYRLGGEARTYIPDFIVLVDDGRGEDDPLHLIVEIKGYRGEDAKVKKSTMDTYWVPGVNALGTFGRWAFAEFTDVYEIEAGFDELIGGSFPRPSAALPRCHRPNPPPRYVDRSQGIVQNGHEALYRGGTGRAPVDAQTDHQSASALAGEAQGKARPPTTQLPSVRRR